MLFAYLRSHLFSRYKLYSVRRVAQTEHSSQYRRSNDTPLL